MNAEFNWWLLIVGLVLGAALTWLVMAESTRRDADVNESEQRGEALWIATMLSSSGEPPDAGRVEQILRLHREYLAAPPPDDPEADVAEEPVAIEPPEPDVPAASDDDGSTADAVSTSPETEERP